MAPAQQQHREHTRIDRTPESETTHTNIAFGQGGRDSMILVHLLHNCLLSSQQSLSHKWSRGKQHSPHKCSLGDTSLNKVGGIQGKRCDSTKAPPALTQHWLREYTVYRDSLKEKEEWDKAEEKLQWQHGYGRILVQLETVLLSILFQKYGSKLDILKTGNSWKIQNGNNFLGYFTKACKIIINIIIDTIITASITRVLWRMSYSVLRQPCQRWPCSHFTID